MTLLSKPAIVTQKVNGSIVSQNCMPTHKLNVRMNSYQYPPRSYNGAHKPQNRHPATTDRSNCDLIPESAEPTTKQSDPVFTQERTEPTTHSSPSPNPAQPTSTDRQLQQPPARRPPRQHLNAPLQNCKKPTSRIPQMEISTALKRILPRKRTASPIALLLSRNIIMRDSRRRGLGGDMRDRVRRGRGWLWTVRTGRRAKIGRKGRQRMDIER